MDVEMHQVGAAFDFHGSRAVYRMDVESMRRSVQREDRLALEELVAAVIAGRQRWPHCA